MAVVEDAAGNDNFSDLDYHFCLLHAALLLSFFDFSSINHMCPFLKFEQTHTDTTASQPVHQ